MPATYRPSSPVVIIGLGGTGQWVLTYVKKNLIETFGEVPSSVRLLAIDTTGSDSDSQASQNIQNNSPAHNRQEDEVKVGNVKLDSSEYEYFQGDLYPYALGVRDNPERYSHLSTWFQADWYLNNLPRGQFYLASGAGQLRQFGRMGVFLDLAQGQPRAVGRIRQAIEQVRSQQGANLLHVFVVASLVGGTGSGMFIDLAHIVRKVAGDRQRFRLHGFLALQNTFQTVLGDDDYSRVYASVRELNRFQQVLQAKYPIYYTEPSVARAPAQLYRGVSNDRLFDYCYLMDGDRNAVPLNAYKPNHGVYPTMAECITMALDPETSRAYFNSAINHSAASAQIQSMTGKAVYYSLGTYTYILPVDDIIEKATYRMAKELLSQRLVQIRIQEDTDREFAGWDVSQTGLGAPANQARNFLKTDHLVTSEGKQVDNCSFIKQMSIEFEAGPFNDPQRVQFMAEQNELLLTWLKPVASDDDAFNKLSSGLVATFSQRLADVIQNGPAMGEAPETAPGKIEAQIRKYRSEKLGEVSMAGEVEGEVKKGLNAWKIANRSQFTEFLKVQLLDVLNGSVGDDQIKAKSGKLAYSRDFLQSLILAFTDYNTYLKDIKDARTQAGHVAQADQQTAVTRQVMYSSDSISPSFWANLQKVPEKAQTAYIEAEDYLYYTQRNDLLYQVLLDLNSEFKVITQKFLDQIEEWIKVLILGGVVGNKQSREIGVLQEVRRLDEALASRRHDAADIQVFEYLTDDDYEDRLYRRYTSDTKWREVLGQIMWECPASEDGPEFKLMLVGRRPQDAKEPLLNRPTLQETATKHNRDLLLKKLRQYFQDIHDNETVIERMSETKGAGVVRELLARSAPLIRYTPDTQSHLKMVSYICVNPGQEATRDYYETLRRTLQSQAGLDAQYDLIRLTDPHRCIMLTAAFHLLGEDLDAIQQVRSQYMSSFGDIDRLKTEHNFPAEVAAVDYERAITRPPINQPPHLLQPLVVSLLDDEERFKLFARACVFGLIEREQVQNRNMQFRYALRLDRLTGRDDNGANLALTADGQDARFVDALQRFVFSEFDDDDGSKRIVDFNLNLNVLPSRVEEAIELRIKSIRTGQDLIARAIAEALEKKRHWLNEERKPDAVKVISGAMRVLLNKRQALVIEGTEADIQAEIKDRVIETNLAWFSENQAARDQVAKLLAETVVANRDKLYARERLELVYTKIEKYLEKELEEFKSSTDPVVKDVGCVMEVMLRRELVQLEKILGQ